MRKILHIAFLLLTALIGQESAHGQSDTDLKKTPIILDLDSQSYRQVVVDRQPEQYLGHPSTLLLDDQKTVLCVYPKGHGKGAIVFKRSTDQGKTWSDRLPTPQSFATSLETPTLFQLKDANGKNRILLFSGLYPIRKAVSEDDGQSFSELEAVGDWGGIVAMSSIVPLKTAGQYLAFFHDDGRFFQKENLQVKGKTPLFTLYQSLTTDGGMTWQKPQAIYSSKEMHLCEAGAVQNTDSKTGKTTITLLLRENRRVKQAQMIDSCDEGATWSQPQDLPAFLTGDRHTAKWIDGERIMISYRSVPVKGEEANFANDWVAWFGHFEDLKNNRFTHEHYLLRLKKNTKGFDCAYPGVEHFGGGKFLLTTYGHWVLNKNTYILAVHLQVRQLEELSKYQQKHKAVVLSLYDQQSGGFRLTEKDQPSLRATRGAIRILMSLGCDIENKEQIKKFVASCYNAETGTFSDAGKTDVSTTSVGLMAVAELGIGRDKNGKPTYLKAVEYLQMNARSFEEVRIAAAGLELFGVKESGIDLNPLLEVGEKYQATEEYKNGGPRVVGSLAAFRLRLGEKIDQPGLIGKALLDGQNADGGWGKAGETTSDMESTYRVMRALKHLKLKPNLSQLRTYLARFECKTGGGYTAVPGDDSKRTMSSIYYPIVVMSWIDQLEAE